MGNLWPAGYAGTLRAIVPALLLPLVSLPRWPYTHSRRGTHFLCAADRKANEGVLTSLGINYVKDISEKYPEFINLDHPLFENIIGLFDKDDLIEKLNADITVIPQILDYWKNN